MLTTSRDQIWRDRRAMRVLGMGTALPGAPITNDELLDRLHDTFNVDVRRKSGVVAHRLGINTRHLCRDLLRRSESPRAGDGNADLCARAVRAALEEAQLEPNDLVYLIGHTTSPGRVLPPNITQVADLLGYGGPFLELRQACTGFANALVIAEGLLRACENGPVAIVGSETGSVYFDPLRVVEDPGQLVNMMQMGDGAAACVLAHESTGSGLGTISNVYYGYTGLGKRPGFSLQTGGSDFLGEPERPCEFTHDFAAVGEQGVSLFERGFQAAQSLGVDISAIDHVIPHQANGRMADVLARHLGIDKTRVFVNADRVGNTGSAAIWLAFAELRTRLRRDAAALVLGAEATKYMFGGFCYVHD